MGHRIISHRESDVKMQVFGNQVAADSDHRGCPEDLPPRGRKRKYEDGGGEDGEEEQTTVTAPGGGRRPDSGSGADGGRHRVYVVHRQSVFNISMCKLHRYRQIPDPCLRKSVLICNTLRTIECEMVSEGMELDVVAGGTLMPFLPAIRPAADDVTTLDPPPPSSALPNPADGAQSPPQPLPASAAALSPLPSYNSMPVPEPRFLGGCGTLGSYDGRDDDDDDEEREMADDDEEDEDDEDDSGCVLGYEKSLTDLDCASGRATPRLSPPPPSSPMDQRATEVGVRRLPSASFWTTECCEDRSPGATCGVGTCISWSSVLDFSSQSDVDAAVNSGLVSEDAWSSSGGGLGVGGGIGGGGDDGGGGTSTSGPNTSPSASSDSGISTASDEIFGDIDLSLYDFDLLPLSPPSARVVAPPTAEELLRAFADERSRPSVNSSRSPAPLMSTAVQRSAMCPSVHCATEDYRCREDVDDEEDHVMHVTAGIQTL